LRAGRDPVERVVVNSRGVVSDGSLPGAAALKVGLFGLLGSGNTGNDA
jgi:hypothetical protein